MKRHQERIMFITRTIFIITAVCFAAVSAYPKTAAELLNEGQMNLYKGHIKEGLHLLEQSRAMDDTLEVKLLLAKGYSWNNEWEKAKAIYLDIENTSSPDNQIYWDARFGFAQVTSWEKKYDDALVQYQYILDTNKKITAASSIDIKLAISDIHSWKLDYDKAIDYLQKLAAEYPGNTEVLNRIAKIYLWKNEIPKSKEYNDKVLSLDAKDFEAMERKETLDQIKPFAVSLGYEYAWYDSKNFKGDNITSHSSMIGLNWQYSVPLKIFTYITGIVQNSIESADQKNSAKWHNDTNLRIGGIYRINDKTFTSAAFDYTYDAEIFPDFSGEFSLSRKLTQHIDVIGLYKFTYDKLDTNQTIKSKKYNLFSPGFIFYYNPDIYNKIQFYAETDSKDFSYSVLVNQHVAINPENIFQLYLFLSQGRSYLVFSDTSVRQKVTTYSGALSYNHFFTSSFGMEFTAGLTTRVNSYTCYRGGINGIFKW